MKKVYNPYANELESAKGKDYINEAHAIMAAAALMMYFSNEGYLVSSHLNKLNKTFEVTVHFDYNHYPSNPNGYTYSYYNLRSHQYYNEMEQRWVRTKTYFFTVQ